MRSFRLKKSLSLLAAVLVVVLLTANAALAKPQKTTTITCVKGNLEKRIRAVKPKCPAGYELRSVLLARAKAAAEKAAAEKAAAEKAAAEKAAAEKAAAEKVRTPTALVVLDMIAKERDRKGSPPPIFSFHYQTISSSDIQDRTEFGLNQAAKVYSDLGFSGSSSTVLVLANEPWFIDKTREFGCSAPQFLDTLGWIVPNSCPGRVLLVAREWNSRTYSGGLDGLRFQHVLAHEYFHQLQFELRGLRSYPAPIWFIEGAAHFFSALAYASWNSDARYETHLDSLIKEPSSNYFDSCLTVDVATIPSSGTWEERKCGYSKGAKATEFFISRFGFQAYRDVLTQLRLANFNTAFQKATGVEIDAFYRDLNTFLFEQGWSK